MTRHTTPTTASLQFEQALWAAGLPTVFGIDEAGRGAWAGPVTAGAVCLPADPAIAEKLIGVNDSKQLSPRQRDRLIETIITKAQAWGVGIVEAAIIDQEGIIAATCTAMRLALTDAAARFPHVLPQHLLVDQISCRSFGIPHQALIRGDSRSLSIAAASILAKVTRDRLMVELGIQYPAYDFARHKGYGTERHHQLLAQHGLSPIHRRTFKPMQTLLDRLL